MGKRNRKRQWQSTDFDRLERADDSLLAMVERLWTRGWMPLDLLRLVEGHLDGSARELMRSVIMAEHRRAGHGPGTVAFRWIDQLEAVESGGPIFDPPVITLANRADRDSVVATTRDLCELLAQLPDLPMVCEPPGRADAPNRVDMVANDAGRQPMLTRIRALLAKAEATEFPEEADAFTSKAQELMAAHSIDEAMLCAGSAKTSGPAAIRMHVYDPYASAKSTLVATVAAANRCKAIWHPSFGFSTVFGHQVDLDGVELLFTSLLLQATKEMIAEGGQTDEFGRSRTRSFRHSFLIAFAHRIGVRLREASDRSTSAAAARHGDAVLPVLASRQDDVEAAVREVFPRLSKQRDSLGNASGARAGVAAANRANLGPGTAIAG